MRRHLGLLSALFLVAGVTLAQHRPPTGLPLARQKVERVQAIIKLGSLPAYGLRFWSATSTPASA